MNRFIGNLKSRLKDTLKILSEKIITNPLTRKKLRVMLTNVNMLRYINCKQFGNQTDDIFNYKSTIKTKYKYYSEYYRGNMLYGTETTINTYAEHDEPIKACIEHGVYFGDTVFEAEIGKSGLPAVLTFSSIRKDHIMKKSDKLSIPIGPYINYARPFGENDLEEKFEKLGKTLLAFPIHSTDTVKCSFDIANSIDHITRFKKEKGFESVLICMFYRDIELGRDKYYLDAGFKIVSAGYKIDPLFLPRLKTILLLSDYVWTNDVGTHNGYAVFLKKPVFIWKQEREYVGRGKDDVIKNVPIMKTNSAVEEKKEVYDAFNTFSETVTDKQIAVCNKYWGFEHIKNLEEMRSILISLDEVFALGHTEKKWLPN